MYRIFSPGDRVVTVGNSPNCRQSGRYATVRGNEPNRYSHAYNLYIVVFDDGHDNYDIDGSPGYILREYEMEFLDPDEPRYDMD